MIQKLAELLELILCNSVDLSRARTYCDTPLQLAVELGSVPIVDLFVRCGVPLNDRNQRNSTLHTAISNGHVQMVKYLVQNGADVNEAASLYSVSVCRFDQSLVILPCTPLQNYTPLHKAVDVDSEESLDFVNILLAANANLRKLNDAKQTPVHLAALSGMSSSIFKNVIKIPFLYSICFY